MSTLKIWRIIPALLACGVAGVASAKLPPVDPAKAEEAKVKAAEAAKKNAELLTKAQDRVVSQYKKQKGAAAKK